jgi:CRISPR-associated protein Cmr5
MADYTPKANITLKSKAPMPTTSLDQQRAAYAWECVQGCNGDYTNLAKAAPALIMNNGLMQALAFYQSKGKPHHLALNKHIREWLKARFPKQFSGDNYAEIMQGLFGCEDPHFYQQATDEALALLRWIRQFAAVNS